MPVCCHLLMVCTPREAAFWPRWTKVFSSSRPAIRPKGTLRMRTCITLNRATSTRWLLRCSGMPPQEGRPPLIPCERGRLSHRSISDSLNAYCNETGKAGSTWGKLDDLFNLDGGVCRSQLNDLPALDRKSTRLNSSHRCISYAVFCLKKKKNNT